MEAVTTSRPGGAEGEDGPTKAQGKQAVEEGLPVQEKE